MLGQELHGLLHVHRAGRQLGGQRPAERHAHHVTTRAPREALLHALTPEEILGLARVAYGKAPQGLLVTVAGKDFSFVERLSDEVLAAVPAAVDKAQAWLAPYLAR